MKLKCQHASGKTDTLVVSTEKIFTAETFGNGNFHLKSFIPLFIFKLYFSSDTLHELLKK